MKTPGRVETTKPLAHIVQGICAALATVSITLGITAAAGDVSTNTTTSVAIPAAPTIVPDQAPTSQGVAEILKMADAGISRKVLTAYIENSETACQLTDVDVIALKKHNVDDEVVTMMLKRGAQSRAAVAQAKNDILARALDSRNTGGGGLDPESYNYFQYYYLQPRALESVYQRLSPYCYPPFPYACGHPFRYR